MINVATGRASDEDAVSAPERPRHRQVYPDRSTERLLARLVTPFLIPFFVIVYHVPRADVRGCVRERARRGGCYAGRAAIALMALFPIVRLLPVSMAIDILAPALRVIGAPIQQAAMSEMVLGGSAAGRSASTKWPASPALQPAPSRAGTCSTSRRCAALLPLRGGDGRQPGAVPEILRRERGLDRRVVQRGPDGWHCTAPFPVRRRI
jgi:hypothetical protein